MTVKLSNNVRTTLAAALSATATTLVVKDGTVFPALGTGEYYYLTLQRRDGASEIVRVTAAIGPALTAVRGVDGTSPMTFFIDDLVEMRVTAASVLDAAQDAADAVDELRADLASDAAGKGAGLVAFKQTGAGAVARIAQDKLRETISVKDFGALGNGVDDDTAAIRLALATGKRVVFPQGDYVVTGELEVVTPGQVIEFENMGGFGYGEDIGLNWTPNTRIIASGTFTKRIRTRRLYRASVADPQDAPLSVVFNIQAESVVLSNVCVWLDCDYSDASPTNLGADCDVGVFVGTRVGVQMHNLQVIGYFRRAGLYLDVSGATALPRFNDLSGNPYPAGPVRNGGDGTHLWNPYIRGARVGLAVLGAKPKTGETAYTTAYYDELLGTTVADARGSFGFSDFAVFGGRIYGPDHHSQRRRKDPELDGGVLNLTSMVAEPDDAPAAVHIDGLAGNASTNLWGMRFYGTRMATFEAFRVRLDKVSRVSFIGAHIEGRSGGGRLSATGVSIDSNNYVTTSYGDIAGTTSTDRITVFGSARQSYADGLAPHFYGSDGKPFFVTDSGRLFIPSYVEAGADVDLRAATGSGFRFRESDVSKATLDDTGLLLSGALQSLRSSSGDLDLRSAPNQSIVGRIGTTTRIVLTNTDLRLSGAFLNFGNGTSFPTIRTGAGAPEDVVTARIGSLYLRTDGGAGTSFYVKESGTGNTGWVAK
jgi:hypothetical protein